MQPKPEQLLRGAMAAPSPGPREVGADPREDRRGKGLGGGAGPPLRCGADTPPPKLRRGPAPGGDQDTPHVETADMKGKAWRVSLELTSSVFSWAKMEVIIKPPPS